MNEININVSKLLDGQIVLVTGAGQGNGRAIAKGIARSGARVVVTDVQLELAETTVQQIRSDGGEASAFHLDVTDPKECVSVAERIRSEIGPVNVVVNNAGIIIRENIDSPKAHENWRRVMDVNVNGVFNVIHACLPDLRRTRGSIINVGSIASFVGVADTPRLFALEGSGEAVHPGPRSRTCVRWDPGKCDCARRHRNTDDANHTR